VILLVRRYTRWKDNESTAVKRFFKEHISSRINKLPGKAEIEKFLHHHPFIPHDWTTVKTKVMNERNKVTKKVQSALDALT